MYVPAGDSGAGPGGGLYRPTGELVRASALFREVDESHQVTVERTQLPDDPVRCQETVVYVGSLFTQFGHLLSESMARLWYALGERPDLRILWHGHDATSVRHVHRVVAALGISDRLLRISRPTVFREVHIPEPTFVLRNRVHPRHLEATRRIALEVLDGGAPITTQQPLYLSRARLEPESRTVHGELTLIRRLRREGVKVIDPQALDLDEQIKLVNRHETIIGPIGSAHFSALLTMKGRDRVYLCHTLMRSFFLMDLVTQDRSCYLQTARPVRSTQAKVNPFLDVSLTMSALRDIGVLSSKSGRGVRAVAHTERSRPRVGSESTLR